MVFHEVSEFLLQWFQFVLCKFGEVLVHHTHDILYDFGNVFVQLICQGIVSGNVCVMALIVTVFVLIILLRSGGCWLDFWEQMGCSHFI